MLIADDVRVKTMRWTENGTRLLNIYTLCSDSFKGPMAILGHNLIRAGKGAAGVWNLSTASTHGPDGTEIIGDELDAEDSWRDNDGGDEIELSGGSTHDSEIKFVPELEGHKAEIWTPAPSFTTSTILSTASSRSNPTPSILAIDLESNGQISSRFLGHDALISVREWRLSGAENCTYSSYTLV